MARKSRTPAPANGGCLHQQEMAWGPKCPQFYTIRGAGPGR